MRDARRHQWIFNPPRTASPLDMNTRHPSPTLMFVKRFDQGELLWWSRTRSSPEPSMQTLGRRPGGGRGGQAGGSVGTRIKQALGPRAFPGSTRHGQASLQPRRRMPRCPCQPPAKFGVCNSQVVRHARIDAEAARVAFWWCSVQLGGAVLLHAGRRARAQPRLWRPAGPHRRTQRL